MTVSELCSKLQTLAHQGYAIHEIELTTECESCSSDVTLFNPSLEVMETSEKTVKLIFKQISLA